MQTPEPVRRTVEIEDLTNLYFIHPIANRLTPLLARMHVRPNAVSVTGMACGILAGFAYFHFQQASWALAGFLLMIAWHVLDGVDGQLARLTRSQSELGKILDGVCDYVTFIAVYAGLALALTTGHGQHHAGWVWLIVLAAGVCHALQAATYEAQRQEYDYWAWDRKSKGLVKPDASRGDAARAPAVLRVLHDLYAAFQRRVGADLHRRLDELLSLRPDRAGRVRQRYRQVFAQPVRRWSILSANVRTTLIFICAILGAPLQYFWFEIIGFTMLLTVLAAIQRERSCRFLAEMEMLD